MLFLECLTACLIFHVLIYSSVIKDPISWINSYPLAIKERLKQLKVID